MSTQEIAIAPKPVDVFGIRRIRVDQLFGQFSYDLKLHADSNADSSRLMILYGDNGSGKTTILRLVVHLLSHIDGEGHKAVVSRVRFKRVVIHIGSDVEVEAFREDINHRGFHAYVRRQANTIAEADYYFRERRDDEEAGRRHREFLQALRSLNLGLFFLADDRKVTSNVQIIEEPAEIHAEYIDLAEERRLVRLHGRHEQLRENTALDLAVARFTKWATQQAITGSTQGEDDVNTIYTRIIQRLATARRRKIEKTPKLDGLVVALQEQVGRSEAFSQFGLAAPPKIHSLLAAIAASPKNTHDVIAKVLAPWIDSIKARLAAQHDVYRALSTFVALMNGFYTNKSVSIDVRHGISIKMENGEVLRPSMLSSGERQLLLLFCNTIPTRSTSSILIIDEPELSLNVKWQRKLLSSLLQSTRDSQVQFIVATHSIELLTRHKDSVVQLVSEQTAEPL